MNIQVNGTDYEIKDVIHQKQDPEFYEALEKKDAYLANILFKPPTIIPYWMIKSRIDSIVLYENHKAELKRIEEMSPEMLQIEIELKFKNRCK